MAPHLPHPPRDWCRECHRPWQNEDGDEDLLSARKHKPPPTFTSNSYTPLPKKRGAIRLLNLFSSSKDNPQIECELIDAEFDDDGNPTIPYEALSWCWGTDKANAYVNIRNGQSMYAKYVKPDVVSALQALRHPQTNRCLWIDAICINQDNFEEKNHQVEMMADIYGKAERVCIWLGDGDGSSQMALKFIKKEVLQLQNFDELCESEQATEKWGALLDLMQRPWFSRRWVVQEIALARNATLYCGADKISWNKFAVAVELFVEVETATHRLSEVMKKDPRYYHVPGWFEYVSALGASLLVDATGKLFRDYKAEDSDLESDSEGESELDTDSDSEPDKEDSDREGYSEKDFKGHSRTMRRTRGQPLLSLEYLVSSLSIFDASVEHDTIYALLAIAKDTTPSASNEESRLLLDHTQLALEVFTQKKRYKVDYNQAYVDVCKDFVQFCIERSLHVDPTRALDVICRPWATEEKKPLATRRDTPFRPKNRDKSNKIKSGRAGRGKRAPKPPKSENHHAEKNGEKAPDDTAKDEMMKIEDPRDNPPKEEVPLPSWIPQLTGAPYAMYSHAGIHTLKMGRKNADTLVGLPSLTQRNYNAAETKRIDLKTLKFRKRPNMKHYSMYVKGFVLDTVGEVQHSSQGGSIPQEWAEMGGWPHAPRGNPPDHFWRTLVADRGRDGKNPPVYYARACKESFAKGGLMSGSVNTTDLINNERCSVVAQFCRRVQAVIWNRALIKTKTGRLGLVSKNVQRGDLVCILYGCSVPVILRRSERKTEPEPTEEELAELEKERMRKEGEPTEPTRRQTLSRRAQKEPVSAIQKPKNPRPPPPPKLKSPKLKGIKPAESRPAEQKFSDPKPANHTSPSPKPMDRALKKPASTVRKPTELEQEIEEELLFRKEKLVECIRTYIKRVAAFKRKRDEAKMKYKEWEDAKRKLWRKDQEWWKRWRQELGRMANQEEKLVKRTTWETFLQSLRERSDGTLCTSAEGQALYPQRLWDLVLEKQMHLGFEFTAWKKEKRAKHKAERKREEKEKEEREKEEKEKGVKGKEEREPYEKNKEEEMYNLEKRMYLEKRGVDKQKNEKNDNGKNKNESSKQQKVGWNEPSVNWKEFELLLKYGRLWKKRYADRRKELLDKYEAEWEKRQEDIIEAYERKRRPEDPQPNGAASSTSTLINPPPKEEDTVSESATSERTDHTPAYESSLSISEGFRGHRRLQSEDRPRSEYQQSAASESGRPQSSHSARTNEAKKPLPRFTEEQAEEYENMLKKKIKKSLTDDDRYHYQLLGECYIHGMMDGGAMAFQNSRGIPATIFEIR